MVPVASKVEVRGVIEIPGGFALTFTNGSSLSFGNPQDVRNLMGGLAGVIVAFEGRDTRLAAAGLGT
jgi:hypothetical protein